MFRIGLDRFTWAVVGITWLSSLGCNSASDASHEHATSAEHTFSGEYPIKVVATTGQVAELVAKVGGEHVKVEGLMGPGVDPHLYRPIASDVKKLDEADAIFYNGLHLEGRMTDFSCKWHVARRHLP